MLFRLWGGLHKEGAEVTGRFGDVGPWAIILYLLRWSSFSSTSSSTAKQARQLRKQVDRLRPDQAAPRWLSLCSPRPGKKRI